MGNRQWTTRGKQGRGPTRFSLATPPGKNPHPRPHLTPSCLFPLFPFLLLLLACSSPRPEAEAAPSVLPPAEEIVSFPLRRVPIALAFDPSAALLVIVDPEVVRLLDATGFELWGRRLDIGRLSGAAFCRGALVVWGEEGVRLLDRETGLVRSGLPEDILSRRVLSVAGDQSTCAFLEETKLRILGPEAPGEIDLPPGGRILARAGGGWLVGGQGLSFLDQEGVASTLLPQTEPILSLAVKEDRLAVLSTRLRLFSLDKEKPPSLLWERALGEEGLAPDGSVPLHRLLPLGFWAGHLAHGASGLGLYDQETGSSRLFPPVDPKGEPITALAARHHRLALVYRDGTVALWEGTP